MLPVALHNTGHAMVRLMRIRAGVRMTCVIGEPIVIKDDDDLAAIKLARKHARTKLGAKGTPVIITALNSFHGRTLAAITATGQPKYQENFGPLPGGFEYTPYNDIDALKALVKKINGGLNPFRRRSLAAIMLEPLQGEGGIRPGERAFFEAARAIADETGALLMFDEVRARARA